eukprot:s2852_g17.t1
MPAAPLHDAGHGTISGGVSPQELASNVVQAAKTRRFAAPRDSFAVGWEDVRLDFLIAGFARSGTHSVRGNLMDHEEVTIARDELTFNWPARPQQLQDMQAWLVLIARIALPVFILFVAFGPKIDAWLSSWGPAYSKDELLRHWKATKGPKPSELSNLTMVTAETAPLLFQKPEVPDRSKQKKKGEKVDKSEKVDKADKADKMAEKSAHSDRTDPEDLAKTDKSSANQQELHAMEGSVKPDDAAKQMHFESLMNYMAFNRHQPQRVFLPAGDPPPPKKLGSQVATITGKDARQANLEAQMVLSGALELELETPTQLLSGVARSLCDQLSGASVEIQSETFALMVKACIKVNDLTACSDFLCRIEAAGQVLDNRLMDHVMELYWDQKRQQEPQEPQEATAASTSQMPGALNQPFNQQNIPEPFAQAAGWGMSDGRDGPGQPFDLPAFSVPEEFKAVRNYMANFKEREPRDRSLWGGKGEGVAVSQRVLRLSSKVPRLRLIILVREPVEWLESLYNLRKFECLYHKECGKVPSLEDVIMKGATFEDVNVEDAFLSRPLEYAVGRHRSTKQD